MRYFFLCMLISLFSLAACKEKTEPYRAIGNEPGWMLTMDDQAIELLTHYGEKKLTAKPVALQTSPEGARYNFDTQGHKVSVQIIHADCKDVMSGQPFPDQVTVQVDEEFYTGCGGPMSKQTASSLQSPPQAKAHSLVKTVWVVGAMNEQPLRSEAQFNMTLREDGRVVGTSGCNHYSTTYKAEGDTLTISPEIISTKMACLPEVMELENQFLDILRLSNRISLRTDGMLDIQATDGHSLTFRVGEKKE